MTGYFDLPDLIITMADQHQEMSTNTPSKSQTEAPEKEDIRMLGRMLGDTIREKKVKIPSIWLKKSAGQPSVSGATPISARQIP